MRICDVFICGVQTKRKPSDHILGKRECSEYLIKFVLESEAQFIKSVKTSFLLSNTFIADKQLNLQKIIIHCFESGKASSLF